MFNGLKKMVGKSTDDTSNIHAQPPVHQLQSNVTSNRFTKKRKVIKKEYSPNIKKK